MLVVTKLPRLFLFEDKGQQIKLSDPEPKFSLQAVQNFVVLCVGNADAVLAHRDRMAFLGKLLQCKQLVRKAGRDKSVSEPKLHSGPFSSRALRMAVPMR